LRALVRFALTISLTFLGLTAITFVIGRVMPVDPVLASLGDRAPREVYERVYQEMGLDRPVYEQYGRYLAQLAKGDLGISLTTTQPVSADIGRVFPATLELATVATLMGILLGVPMGVWAAVHRDRWPDHLVRVLGLFGYSVPVFWLGMVALLVFYGWLDWAPGPGRLDIYYTDLVPVVSGLILLDAALAEDWTIFRNALAHLALPSTILGTYSLAYIARMTRSFMLEQLGQEYILTARIKGLPERTVIWRHAFGNVLIQLITVIGLTYAALLEGSVLTETVFAWPGIGQYVTSALFNADLNAVLGGTIVIGACFVGVNLFSDLCYRLADPRAR